MKRDIVLSLIHKHRAELNKFGVKSLALFGSVARGEESPESDVDILVEYQGPATFDRFMDTKYYLEDLLGCKVDLVTPQAIKPRMKPYIMQDLLYDFPGSASHHFYRDVAFALGFVCLTGESCWAGATHLWLYQNK